MNKTNDHQSLREALADHSYWIYTDGSAITTGVRSGSYAAMILEEGTTPMLVAGACNETTINRMELLAINAALRRVFELVEECVHGVRVTIVTDSQMTQKTIIGENKRNKNLDLWAQFDVLSSGYEEITVLHSERNIEAPQSQADAICDVCRKAFDKLISGIIGHEQFGVIEITRKTKFKDGPDKTSDSGSMESGRKAEGRGAGSRIGEENLQRDCDPSDQRD